MRPLHDYAEAMESSTSTEPVERAAEPAPNHEVNTEIHTSMVAPNREQCSACGAAMAPDQRYCVECGERRGTARVAMLDAPAQQAGQTPPARRPPRRVRTSINSTLIAGIGLLLLAMGVGVLIGRSGSTSSKTPPAQVVTVAGAGGAAAGAAATSTAPQAPTGSTGATKSSSTTVTATKSTSKKAAGPPPKTVKVGSPGTGPGYQKGHFTGQFFGGGESE